jgi:hypothetical protein
MICEDNLNHNLNPNIEVGCGNRQCGAYRGGVTIVREVASMIQHSII